MVLTALLAVSVFVASSGLTADSILAKISIAGTFARVTAKFSLFFSRRTSASLRDLDDNLMIMIMMITDNPVSLVN